MWDGGSQYWINPIQDGTFLGNPIYRVEKGSSDAGYFYKYSVSGLEYIQDAEEYTMTGIFKSSNSSQSVQPLDYPYQGAGSPWTTGNYVHQYASNTYQYYLNNGWWRYIYTFKVDRNQITTVQYRKLFFFGFQWNWASAGQYFWGTQPGLYLGTHKKYYQGIQSQFDVRNIRSYNDSLGFEGPITNQITTSNMENYQIGHTGNVCGFGNNFTERFGAGNWSTQIVYQDNSPMPSVTKCQRIITKASGWGGWTSGNIGNTSGTITYGVLIRLHYGEIQFGDLNTSSRLYINQSYYQSKGKKLGDWVWQIQQFPATGSFRHLYQSGPTKADIQQVQIYNGDNTVGYVSGSANASVQTIPTDWANLFKNEFTVSFVYEPLATYSYLSYPQIFTLNWWTSDRTQDWLGIYRGNSWSGQDQLLLHIIDGTRQIESGTSLNGINALVNHRLFIAQSYSQSLHKYSVYVYDMTGKQELLKSDINLDPAFQFDKTFSYCRLGYLNEGDSQNQKISNLSIHAKYMSAADLYRLFPKTFGVDKLKHVKVNLIQEPKNILDRYTPQAFETGSLGGIWSQYTQTNCSVSIVPVKYRQNKYSYFVYRPPNLTYDGSSSVQDCGGVVLSFPDDKTFEEGATYRLSFDYFGHSDHIIQIYFAYSVGWTNYVGLTGLFLPYITNSFDELAGQQHYEQSFTIPPGYIYQTGTDQNVYFCMREMKIGYTYTQTSALGEKLFVNNICIEKISGNESHRQKYGINKNGIMTRRFAELNSGAHDIFLVGTCGDQPYSGLRQVNVDGQTIVNNSSRGLNLAIFNSQFQLISSTNYDIYGDDQQRTNLQAQLAAIQRSQYWQLTSYDQMNTNSQLTAQLQQMNSTLWPLTGRSPYQQFGFGQRLVYETGTPYNQLYRHRQVLNFKI